MKDIKKIIYEGYQYIDGGVCAAKDFAPAVYTAVSKRP